MNLFLAPIQGMTIAHYRNTYAKIFGGIDAYYAPFIATCEKSKSSPVLFKDLIKEKNDASIKVIPQLLSNNGEDFKFFAQTIADMGYSEINWNIGCPYPMVTKKKKGSGILPHTDMIRKVLETACSSDSYNITVKMRLGFVDVEEGLAVMDVLNEYPLGGVIIHARTGKQMYTGEVDLKAFESLANSCRHEVTYNGDIYTYDDYIRISSRLLNIQNYMLGRGALRDPFLPALIKGKVTPNESKMNILRHFHDEIVDNFRNTLSGEKHLCDRMKGFWEYMSVYTDPDGKLYKKIQKCHSYAVYSDLVDQIFDI